jgi:hypothetical protein
MNPQTMGAAWEVIGDEELRQGRDVDAGRGGQQDRVVQGS